jgi:hypothetical protein
MVSSKEGSNQAARGTARLLDEALSDHLRRNIRSAGDIDRDLQLRLGFSKVILESPWVKHPRVWVTAGVLCMAATLVMWVSNREVPTVIGVPYNTPEVRAGERVRIVLPAQRSLERRCSIRLSRTLVKSDQAQETLVANQFVSADGVEERHKETPGQLVLDILIPESSPPGLSKIRTENEYICPFNPSTWIFPIQDSWLVNINVLPKRTP